MPTFRFHLSSTSIHSHSHWFHPFPSRYFRLIRLVWLVCHQDCCRQQQQALVAATAFVGGYGLFFFYDHWLIDQLIQPSIYSCFHWFYLLPSRSPRQMRLVWLICCWDCCQQQQTLVAALAFVNLYDGICVFCRLIFWNPSTVATVGSHSICPSCQCTLLCTVCYIV